MPAERPAAPRVSRRQGQARPRKQPAPSSFCALPRRWEKEVPASSEHRDPPSVTGYHGHRRWHSVTALAARGPFLYFGHGLMGYLWRVLEWIALGLGITAAAFAAAFVAARRRILRHVRAELGQESLLLAAGARVGGFDGLSNGGGPPS